MKSYHFLLLGLVFTSLSAHAQRGVRVGYIDTEYILENIPEYQEALTLLSEKSKQWKSEIETQLNTIKKKRSDLSNEKALLTKELIEDREEDLDIEESRVLDYQQKRFGPDGDLFIQKKQLMQPIQDQIFYAVQDLAANRKYDFILDKSSDAVMLYASKAFDLSDQIIKVILRSTKRVQAKTSEARKAAKEEKTIGNTTEMSASQKARQTLIENKKAARSKALAERREAIKAAREKRIKDLQIKREKRIKAREKAKDSIAK